MNLSQFYREITDRKNSFYHSTDYYVVSTAWAKKWQMYVDFPNESDPGKIDFSDIICEHGLFICYSELSDFDRPFCAVTSSDWRDLTSKNPPDREICISVNRRYFSGESIIEITKSVPEICKECSQMFKQIEIQEASQFENRSLRIIEKSNYSSLNRDTTIIASHTMIVGDLKLHICQVWDFMPFEQLLSYNQVELLDDSKSLSFYGVTPLMPIYLTKVKEYENYHHFETVSQPQGKETGFEGTILTGQTSQKTNENKSLNS